MCSDFFRAVFLNGLALASALFIHACSVKEERTECPCYLSLDFSSLGSSALIDEGFENLEILLSDNDAVVDERIFSLNDFVKEYTVAVPRTGVNMMIACQDGQHVASESGLKIAEGNQCPRVYMHACRYVPVSEEDRVAVCLHKNYCVISLRIKASIGIPERPFQVRVDGDVDGFCPDGAPREGVFKCCSAPSSEGLCSVRVPRQKDDSLLLEVYFLDSNEIRVFPIGQYMSESGYDWNAEDLEDVEVEMDFTRSGVELSVSKWKKTLSFDITF